MDFNKQLSDLTVLAHPTVLWKYLKPPTAFFRTIIIF